MLQAKSLLMQETNKGANVQNALMAAHGDRYNNFKPETKRRYDEKAASMAAIRARQIEEEKDTVRQELAKLREEERDADADDKRWRMSACRRSSEEVATVQEMWQDPALTDKVVDIWRGQATKEIGAPSVAYQGALQAFQGGSHEEASFLLEHRDSLRSCMLVVLASGEVRIYFFVYGLQNPMLAFFLTATESEVALPSFAAPSYGQDLLRSWSPEFDVQLGSYIFSDEGTLPEGAEVWVKRDIVLVQGCRAVTDSEWVSLDQVLQSLPKVKLPSKEKASTCRRPTVSQEELAREP